MNFNGSNNVLCIASGITFSASFNPGNVTINVYGTFNFNGNVNSNVTFNVYNGGTLNIANGINSVTINNNSGGTVNINSGSSSSGLTVTNAGTFNFSGSQFLNGSITNTGTFNENGSGSITNTVVNNSGTFKYAGNELNGVTLTNNATITLTNTGQVTFQNNTNITNNANAIFTATVPSKVMINQGSFTNNGTVSITNLENQEGNITNNTGATLTFQKGTFQHGGLHNYGAIVVNCPGTSSDCSNPCMRMGNKNSGHFSNDGSLTVHGTLCVGAGVIFHNNGTTTVDQNMNLENSNSQWVQSGSGTTNVSGSTTTNGGTFSGGNLCSNGVNGSVNATLSCGSPAIINDIAATTCKNFSTSIAITASAPSGSSVNWSSLKLINGTDTVLATASIPKLTTTNGSYTISYTASAANVLFMPTANFTGTTSVKYIIAATSGSTSTYAASTKNINVTIATPPSKPNATINIP